LEQPYESQIVPRYERMTPEMKNLLPELYLHNLSTGDFDPAQVWLATPFLTVEDGEAFEGGSRMSAACAAVHLLLE